MLLDKARRGAGLPAGRTVRSRTANSCAAARTPAATTGRWRATSSSTSRASGTAPVKRHSQYRIVGKQPAAPRPAGQGEGRGVHPRHRGGGRGARPRAAAALDAARISRRSTRAAVRKAAKAPIEILREGEFVAFTSDSELAVMRAAEAAREQAKWDGGTPAARRHRLAGLAEGAAVARPHRRTGRQARPAPRGRTVTARYSRPFLTYGSIGHVAARSPNSRTAR